MVNHSCMEDLGFEIDVTTFLAGMGDREQLGDLVLTVIEDRLKIAERLGPDPADKPGDRCFHFDTDVPDIYGEIAAEPVNKTREKFTGMAGMGCGADTGSEQDDTGLLGGHGDPAGTPLLAGQVALSIGAEAAEIAERQVKWFIPFKERMIPVPER
jgi:hypothetical protein